MATSHPEPSFKRPHRSLLQRFLALDRHLWGALVWRLGVVLLLFRPWAWRFEPVAFGPESLEPEILEAARAAGIDPFHPAGWTTMPVVVTKMMLLAVAFALLWWGISRLRRLLARRLGPGAWAALVPVLGYLALQLLMPIIARKGILPGSFLFFTNAVPVWQGWAVHPLLWSDALNATLGALTFLGVLGGELLLLFSEGRSLLKDAQDGALRARLTPHFLHNALNTLTAQIPKDPAGAQETTQRLSGLFEQVSLATARPQVPLSQELAFVEDFLAIERRRLGERLRVSIEIPEEWMEVPVPVLGLQVLVENALKHAISPRPDGGSLTLRARREGAYLWITVLDSGDGTSQGTHGTGQALANLRARLPRPSDLVTAATPEGFEARFRVALA